MDSWTLKQASLSAIILLSTQGAWAEPGTTVLASEARELAGQYQQALQATLQQGIESAGAAGAIDICKQQVPEITEQLAVNGWELRRTGLRVRNPNNAPTPWEHDTLLRMQEMLAQGGDPSTLAVSQLEQGADGAVFHYMQPIMTGALCLNCHGTTLEPALARALDALYPEDQATGFALGDLRGAFAFTRQLEPAATD